jgi:hypothetical protein
MTAVIAWMRQLGNDGAVANARVLTEQRAAESWAVDAMARRLDEAVLVSDRPASAA